MTVLVGWEQRPTRPMVRSPRSGRQRRPAALAVASTPRLSVSACSAVPTSHTWVALLTAGVVTALVVVGLVLLRAGASNDGVPERTAVVEVRTGETLWELAERVAPESPPQAVVQRIRQLNGMSGSTLHPGQPLLVPDGRPIIVSDTPN